ncbi:hypothetical protein ABBQ32_008812 [Trebouxia sp. C0010 RCD-2024]
MSAMPLKEDSPDESIVTWEDNEMMKELMDRTLAEDSVVRQGLCEPEHFHETDFQAGRTWNPPVHKVSHGTHQGRLPGVLVDDGDDKEMGGNSGQRNLTSLPHCCACFHPTCLHFSEVVEASGKRLSPFERQHGDLAKRLKKALEPDAQLGKDEAPGAAKAASGLEEQTRIEELYPLIWALLKDEPYPRTSSVKDVILTFADCNEMAF